MEEPAMAFPMSSKEGIAFAKLSKSEAPVFQKANALVEKSVSPTAERALFIDATPAATAPYPSEDFFSCSGSAVIGMLAIAVATS
jgi:hypothetical protein